MAAAMKKQPALCVFQVQAAFLSLNKLTAGLPLIQRTRANTGTAL